MFYATRLFLYPTREIKKALSILSISESDAMDKKALKKRYLVLVKKYHPDTGGDAEKMKDVTTAYETLRQASPSQLRSDSSSESESPFQQAHHRHSSPPRESVFNDRQMPEEWIEFERMRRAARENPFAHNFGAPPTSEFMRQQQEMMMRQFSFRHAFRRSMFVYFVMTLLAFMFMRILERVDQSASTYSVNNQHVSKINEAHDTYKRRIEIIEKRKRAKENENNDFFVVREPEHENEYAPRPMHTSQRDKSPHMATASVQKIPSSIRGVNYFYPIEGR